jgi:hypothetical protein
VALLVTIMDISSSSTTCSQCKKGARSDWELQVFGFAAASSAVAPPSKGSFKQWLELACECAGGGVAAVAESLQRYCLLCLLCGVKAALAGVCCFFDLLQLHVRGNLCCRQLDVLCVGCV